MKKKVIVIGGGFAGSYISKKLGDEFNVCLIDTKDFFEFTPSILKLIVRSSSTKKLQVPHKSYLKKPKIILGNVTEVTKNHIKVKNKSYDYDYLIICSGSSYNLPIKNKDIILADRVSELKSHYSKLKNSKKVLIIGGGIVGVELAAEIFSKYKNKDITLVNSRKRLVCQNNKRTSKYVADKLSGNGVKILLGERALLGKNGSYATNKGKKIKTDIAFMCTGITPNSNFLKKNFQKSLDKKGYVKVNDYLQVNQTRNIFAIGDVSDARLEKTAHSAERQAKKVVRNIRLKEKEKNLEKYKPQKPTWVISLGRYDGVFERDDFVLTGLIPAMIKFIIEKYILFRIRK